MDTLGRDRFNPPHKKFEPTTGEHRAAMEILGWLRRRPILPTRYFGKWLDTDQWHSRVLTKMIKGGLLYHHPESTNHLNARYRDLAWSPTEAGHRYYEKNGGTELKRNFNGAFRHAWGVSVIGASIDLACKEHDLELTFHSEKPVEYDGKTPDEPPFSIKGERTAYFVGFEFDRNTEPLSSVIAQKLTAYEGYFKNHIFKDYGMPTAFVPIITVNARHQKGLMELVENNVDGKLHPRFLFKTIPDFSDELPPATGHIITEPWQRIGGSFNILEAIWTSNASKSSSVNENVSTQR